MPCAPFPAQLVCWQLGAPPSQGGASPRDEEASLGSQRLRGRPGAPWPPGWEALQPHLGERGLKDARATAGGKPGVLNLWKGKGSPLPGPTVLGLESCAAGRGVARRDPAATSSPDKHARSADSGLRPWGSSPGVPEEEFQGAARVCPQRSVTLGLRTVTVGPESQRGRPPWPRRRAGAPALLPAARASSKGHATLALRAVDQASQVRAPGPFLQSAPVANSPVPVSATLRLSAAGGPRSETEWLETAVTVYT